KDEAVLRVPGSISGSFEEQFSRDLARALELCPRFGLIALEHVNHAFRESLWCRGRSGSKHRFTAKSFQELKRIRKLPLRRLDRVWRLFPDSQLIPPTCPDAAEWNRWPDRPARHSAVRVWQFQIRQERARNRDRHSNKRNRVRDGLREDRVAVAGLRQR